MPRKKEETSIDKNLTREEYINMLSDFVPVYFKDNKEYNAYKSTVNSENGKIKEIMSIIKQDSIEVDGYIVSITRVDKSQMDNDKLLNLVKTEFPEELQKKLICTKTIEFIDEDALEDIMYKGMISEKLTASMANCMIPKEELRLNVKAKKEEK